MSTDLVRDKELNSLLPRKGGIITIRRSQSSIEVSALLLALAIAIGKKLG